MEFEGEETILTLEERNAWCSPKDLSESEIQVFNPYRIMGQEDVKIHNDLNLSSHSVGEIQSIYQKAMILSVRNELTKIKKFIPLSYIVLLTDENGTILDLFSPSTSAELEIYKAELNVGTSLARHHSGINAVSLAMEMGRLGVVRGIEHSSSLFYEWNCVCSPIYLDGLLSGYLDISFYKEQQVDFAIPFVQQIAENISEKWLDGNSNLLKYKLEINFQKYKLTAREREVAHFWFLERSALHISNSLGITEGTVRNMIKSIYKKLKVTDRWQFAKKLTAS